MMKIIIQIIKLIIIILILKIIEMIKQKMIIVQKGKTEINISMNDNLLEKNIDDEDDVSSLVNNSDLFDRLLRDRRFINFKELILDIKNKKEESVIQKRQELDDNNGDLDIDYLNELILKKTKARYPKK